MQIQSSCEEEESRFVSSERDFAKSGKVVGFPNFAWTLVENCKFFSVTKDGKLGCSKIGDDEWTLVDDKNFYYEDLIVHNGQLYVVDRWGTIFWIDCSSSSSLKLVQFSPPLFALGKKKYLVESCGSLYVVDMYVEGDPNNTRGTYYEVFDLKVYKLDEEWGKWLDVKSLDGRVFVLSKDYGHDTSSPYVVKPEAAAAPAPEEAKSDATPAPKEAEAKPPSEAAVAAAQPTEPPPVSNKISKEPAPAEAPAPEMAEKLVEPEQLPQPLNVEVADQVNASPLETSRTMSEVRFSGMNVPQGPQPIRRAASTASFTSDLSDTMSME
ncbi:hypothetical protein K1719_025004 [Acacia pycnantha]|nr:hypothetical protein K1719_025004 [Acacia pycnantha]